MKPLLSRGVVTVLFLFACLVLLCGAALGAAGFYHRFQTPQAEALAPENGSYCALRAPALAEGSVLTVCDETGQVLHTVSLSASHEALLGPLPEERAYRLLLPDGGEAQFRLEANAAVTALSGALRSDGELLYYGTVFDLLAALPEPALERSG